MKLSTFLSGAKTCELHIPHNYRRFEVNQSIRDEPLRVDPKTGESVRRVISGGYSVLIRGGSTGPSVGSVGSHSGCD